MIGVFCHLHKKCIDIEGPILQNGTVNWGMMYTKTIRGKFIVLILISILLCTVLVGGASLWRISSTLTGSAAQILELTCREEGGRLDEVLHDIQSSVDLFTEIANGRLEAVENLQDEDFLAKYLEEIELHMGQIVRSTQGVCAYYLRIAPERTKQGAGFLYTQKPGVEGLVPEPLTDLSLYDPTDTEHVGWYYQPMQAGKAIWMEPYYNQNLHIYMVSYVVPLYLDGEFWGVAGMDVDFDVVIQNVQRIQPYKTGYAFLTSDEGIIYYHPELPIGSRITDASPELQDLLALFGRGNGREETNVLRYHYRNLGKELAYYQLHNGMELLLTAESREIKGPLVRLFRVVTGIVLLISVIMVLLILPISNRITRPLAQLTEAADQIAKGNMDVALPAPGRDEVGSLTKSFAVTVQSLKKTLAGMNNMANTDPLTHVKNRMAYDTAAERLQERMTAGEREFGYLMLDLNNLKQINDLYGHDRGNEYLLNSCRLICKVFKHSPVFRIGGDEFLVLLEGEDKKQIAALEKEMDRLMTESQNEGEPWKRLSIAKGISMCREEDSTPDAVFHRADQEMYVDKRRMKGLT